MQLVNKSTLKPITIAAFKELHSNISFPAILSNDILEPYGYAVVELDVNPTVLPNEKLIFTGECYELDTKYYLRYEKVEMSDDDINALCSDIRQLRDQLLKESDWTQGKDIPDSISQGWQPYRQALRDITKQDWFPFSINWPEKPE